MAGDNLAEILDLARRNMPDVPASVWENFERLVRANFGTQRVYIASQKKRSYLEALAEADAGLDAAALAKQLGLSVRQLRRYKSLK